MISLRGVDGCPAGWLSVSVELDGGGKPVPKLFPDAEALFRDGVAVTAIDIPIGLSAVRSRSCDTEARRLLGVRKSSVFCARARHVGSRLVPIGMHRVGDSLREAVD